MKEKFDFLMLCWKAYNGDPSAALAVVTILVHKGHDIRERLKD